MYRGLRAEAWVFVVIFVPAFVVRAALLVGWAHGHENFYRLGSGIEDRVAASSRPSSARLETSDGPRDGLRQPARRVVLYGGYGHVERYSRRGGGVWYGDTWEYVRNPRPRRDSQLLGRE